MKRNIIFILTIFMVITAFSAINALSPWNREVNPALIAWSARNNIELGGTLNLGIVQDANLSFEEAMDLNLVGNISGLYDLEEANILGRKQILDLYSKLKLGALVVAPELNITNKDFIDYNKFLENSLWVTGGVYFGLKGKDFSFGATVKSHVPVFDVRCDSESEKFIVVSAFKGRIHELPYDYSLLFDDMKIFEDIEDLSDKLMNNGIITMDIGFVAGKNYPAIGFGLKDITISQGSDIYKYDTNFVYGEMDTEYVEFTNFEIGSLTNEEPFKSMPPWKMTFFLTLPIIFDFVPFIEYAPDTEDTVWGVSAGKALFWGLLPVWAEIRNYSYDGGNINFWRFDGGLGVNVFFGELNISVQSEAPDTDKLFDGVNTGLNINFAVGF
ncbi:hypothetical protein XO10_02950 [Marinitoga sp. 1135]|uniref:DUF5723 domain-containing protein n=1 Tax=Marinitoga piezophila (strain DSM 14283 / JCM 11233 / KA3) TaxID=443254 RepID=H2J5N2_MARPK|nr:MULTISPECIES: hypothetical protein [Marinitoga]AEX85018.1 hypothetical protein Marpi_0577 [Marinitoga piezophila KA3]APT75531.1 hypothetical protein LN42_03325 [Marinitoga sp. 1137]NUU95242.1 hypothetical protein [Marinitoga sp. 1135]NUU97175.1 hypothetical protein [Marinitoga sp. 1138]